MNVGDMNVWSLALGILSLALPVAAMIRFNRTESCRQMMWLMVSLLACAAAICFQMYVQVRLVTKEDWSAMLDTTEASARMCRNLAVFSGILNLCAGVVMVRRAERKKAPGREEA